MQLLQLFAQTECLLWIYQLYGEYDRFYLLDSYSYGEKHNRDNGEENRDGNNLIISFNYGAEGATKNKQIQKMRFQQVKNGLCMTFLSQAVPLLVGGDRCLNSQEAITILIVRTIALAGYSIRTGLRMPRR